MHADEVLCCAAVMGKSSTFAAACVALSALPALTLVAANAVNVTGGGVAAATLNSTATGADCTSGGNIIGITLDTSGSINSADFGTAQLEVRCSRTAVLHATLRGVCVCVLHKRALFALQAFMSLCYVSCMALTCPAPWSTCSSAYLDWYDRAYPCRIP